ncbi:MAG: peptidyl-prolyl cis-trans isomerase [bacterium]|nr:peptidyl-prolyl cis-trans isomerase [bacterium]
MNIQKAAPFFLVLGLAVGAAAGPAAGAEKKKSAAQNESAEVAIINGKKLTLGEINQLIGRFPPTVQIRIRKNREKFLSGLIETELLFQEAIRRKYDEVPGIRARIEQAKQRIVVEEFVRQEVNDAAEVSDAELRDFFEKNKNRFQRKESVLLAHIVTSLEKDAWSAVAELRNGTSFSEVARKRSIVEATRENGGMMGTVQRGELERGIEEVVFKLPIGKFSDPVKSTLGWQIFRVSEKTPAAIANFNDVKDDVRNILLDIKRRAKFQEIARKLRESGNVKVFPERLR